MSVGYRYVRGKKYSTHDHPEKWKRFMDRAIYFVAFGIPIMNFPQLLKVWVEQDASGVSIVSWAGFAFFSVFWFVYGVAHKDKPLIIMNACLVVLQSLIVVGAVLYR